MKTVYGKSVASPRVTKAAALLLATALSGPVFVVLTLVGWLWG
ncbi:hypothetical protein [Falsiruegeria litorea]|nr:hypothetical protein [Falsiruegeria litorea]